MTTQLQIVANQKNAKASTGPRSDEGKQTAARNSVRHGILSRQVVLPWEDRATFDALRESIVRDYAPATALEIDLVEQLAALMWRRRRIADVESWIARRRMSEAGEQGYGFQRGHALLYRGVAPSSDLSVAETLFASEECRGEQRAEAREIMKGIEAAIELLGNGSSDAYDRALAMLLPGTREWWAEACAEELQLRPNAASLRTWLSGEPQEHFQRRLVDFDMAEELREDLCGFASKEIMNSDVVLRYEAHITRQIERTIVLLERLGSFRPTREVIDQNAAS